MFWKLLTSNRKFNINQYSKTDWPAFKKPQDFKFCSKMKFILLVELLGLVMANKEAIGTLLKVIIVFNQNAVFV